MNYLECVPQDIRNELSNYLRGRTLLRYVKLFPSVDHYNFWQQRLNRDYGTNGMYQSYRLDYVLFGIAEEYDITSNDADEVERLVIDIAAERCDLKLIRFFMRVRSNNNDLFLKVVRSSNPGTYNYLWDNYSEYRLQLTIGALLFNHDLIEFPRTMDIPSDVMVKWMMTDEKDVAYLGFES